MIGQLGIGEDCDRQYSEISAAPMTIWRKQYNTGTVIRYLDKTFIADHQNYHFNTISFIII